jgi:hypothetical protein
MQSGGVLIGCICITPKTNLYKEKFIKIKILLNTEITQIKKINNKYESHKGEA